MCTDTAFMPCSFHSKGTRIIEYTGERASWEAAPNDENDPHTFNFGLDNGEVINPEIGGNEARWINHSCEPNCEAVEENDRIFIDAIRDIRAGEELFYDYALEIDEPITEESKKEYRLPLPQLKLSRHDARHFSLIETRSPAGLLAPTLVTLPSMSRAPCTPFFLLPSDFLIPE